MKRNEKKNTKKSDPLTRKGPTLRRAAQPEDSTSNDGMIHSIDWTRREFLAGNMSRETYLATLKAFDLMSRHIAPPVSHIDVTKRIEAESKMQYRDALDLRQRERDLGTRIPVVRAAVIGRVAPMLQSSNGTSDPPPDPGPAVRTNGHRSHT